MRTRMTTEDMGTGFKYFVVKDGRILWSRVAFERNRFIFKKHAENKHRNDTFSC
jgi:hypothetical protein